MCCNYCSKPSFWSLQLFQPNVTFLHFIIVFGTLFFLTMVIIGTTCFTQECGGDSAVRIGIMSMWVVGLLTVLFVSFISWYLRRRSLTQQRDNTVYDTYDPEPDSMPLDDDSTPNLPTTSHQ